MKKKQHKYNTTAGPREFVRCVLLYFHEATHQEDPTRKHLSVI